MAPIVLVQIYVHTCLARVYYNLCEVLEIHVTYSASLCCCAQVQDALQLKYSNLSSTDSMLQWTERLTTYYIKSPKYYNMHTKHDTADVCCYVYINTCSVNIVISDCKCTTTTYACSSEIHDIVHVPILVY